MSYSNNRLRFFFFIFFLNLLSSLAKAQDECPENKLLKDLQLPPGFRIDVYKSDVPGARSLSLGPNGVVFVGTIDEGKVYAIIDRNKDDKGDETITLAKGLNAPNGVTYDPGKGALYVGERERILRFDEIEKNLNEKAPYRIVYDQYPSDAHHGNRFIAMGPDQKLYVPVGAPCNVCKKENPIYSSITHFDEETKKMEIFAHGVRNTVGFDFHPVTRELWFTDNGRDWLGDDSPPDELNVATAKDQHFGFPYCHGGDIADPNFGSLKKCSDLTPPALKLGPHVAALGMRFYTGKMFPKNYQNQIFIAEHGSWNRRKKIGYRVTLVELEGTGPKVKNYLPFLEGFLSKEGKVCGRPVDVLVMPDGALLVSDDQGGRIFRISYLP